MQIDKNNYESVLLMYVDGELTESENREVEAFCAVNPEAAGMALLLKQTVLTPPLTVFPDKASLYREEKKQRVIGWYLWRAAMVVILLTGAFFLYWTLRPVAQSAGQKESMAARKTTGGTKKVNGPDSGVAAKAATLPVPDQIAQKPAGNSPGARPEMALTGTSKRNRDLPEISATAPSIGRKTKKAPVRSGKDLEMVRKSSPVPGNNEPAVQVNPDLQEETGQVIAAAHTTQVDAVPVRRPAALNGNPLTVPADNDAVQKMAAVSGKAIMQGRVPVSDGPAGSETAVSGSDDAVSVLHLAKNSGVVGRLFHRLTSGRNGEDQPGTGGEKRVNISVFQFAVGK